MLHGASSRAMPVLTPQSRFKHVVVPGDRLHPSQRVVPMKKPLRLLALSVLCIGVWIGPVHSTPAAPPAPPLLPDGAVPPARATTNCLCKRLPNRSPPRRRRRGQWPCRAQVRRQDVDAFNTLVDWDAFVEKATALPGNSPQLKEFRDRVQPRLEVGHHFANVGVRAGNHVRDPGLRRLSGVSHS